MKVLTRKQRKYLEELKQRNIKLIKETNFGAEHEKGLSTPMTATERKMRQRIRKNVIKAMFDIALVGNAGLLPDRKLKKQGVKSIDGMLEDVHNSMILEMVCEARKVKKRNTLNAIC